MPTRPQPVKARGHTLSAHKGQAGGAGEEAVEAIDRDRDILVGVAGEGIDVVGHGTARLARRRFSAEEGHCLKTAHQRRVEARPLHIAPEKRVGGIVLPDQVRLVSPQTPALN